MEQSVLCKIPANDICYIYNDWRNGKLGGFVQKDGIYRFREMIRDKNGNTVQMHDKDEENPIVAIGIVAYWLMYNSKKEPILKQMTKYYNGVPKDMRELFDNYTEIRFEQFKENHRDDPNAWDWDWEKEFYTNHIIPLEIGYNNYTEALFDYISDSDIALVRAVMTNYIKYLKKVRTEKGYYVNPELLVLRSIDLMDETKLEDMEDFEVNTIFDQLEKKEYVKVAWNEGHKPEAIRLLDKGRIYMKHLEEGSLNAEVHHTVTTEQPAREDSEETLPQMPLSPEGSGQDDIIEDAEWDDTYDSIFDKKVNPQVLFAALKGIKCPNKIQPRRFYYVVYRVLDTINYFSKGTSEHQYLQWINLHFNDSEHRWIDDHDHIYLFRFKLDGSAKNLKVHPSKWNTIKMYSDLAILHYKLAIDLKNTFTFVVDKNGEEIKDSKSYEHMKDRPQFLSGATWYVNKYLITEDAYINKGL